MDAVASIHKFMCKKERALFFKKQNELINRLDGLGVIVNRPHEMKIEQLDLLVNRHRTTVEKQPDFIPERLEVVRNVKVDKVEVSALVDELGWDTKQAIKHQTRKEERRIRNQKRAQLLQEINRLEVIGETERKSVLEKLLINL